MSLKETADNKEIARLRDHLEKHLEWGNASDWHSSMYTELSDKIFSKCQVMLSAATLKRFWGAVNHEGAPSISTLDTLSQFLDYENWREFKIASGKKRKRSFSANVPRKSLYVTVGFFIALFMILIVGNKRVDDPEVLAAIPFSSRPVTNTFPNSVVFDFDLEDVRSDSLLIQQYWDPNKTIKIQRDQKQATGIYYFPGYFRAKLVVDGQPVKEHDLYLKSDGWIGTIDYQPVPKYFSPEVPSQDRLICPEPLVAEIIKREKPITSTFHYVSDLGTISGDNFTLNSKLKINWSEKWAVCQLARIYILATDGAMIIPFSTIGCSSNNGLMLNDVFLSGKENDLSAFGTDLSKETDLEIKVRSKKIYVSINSNLVYEGEYFKSMGRLVGLRYKFLGVGEVASFSLKDWESTSILELL
ncbi:MAG: hypothetical protein ABJP45_05135 [Cyclobacteriaceae bacterium]